MSKGKTYEAKTEELLIPITKDRGVEIYDVEYVKEGSDWYLRAYIDKEGGITIDDCVLVSRYLSPLLDKYENEIKDAYILEVSSPGLLRPLKKDKDFERKLQEMIEIKLFKPVDQIKGKEFEAQLISYDADQITVLLDNDEKISIQRSNLALVRPAIEF